MEINCKQGSEKRHPGSLGLFRIGLDCYTGACALGRHCHMSLDMRYRKSSYPTGRLYPLWWQTKYIINTEVIWVLMMFKVFVSLNLSSIEVVCWGCKCKLFLLWCIEKVNVNETYECRPYPDMLDWMLRTRDRWRHFPGELEMCTCDFVFEFPGHTSQSMRPSFPM